MEKTPQLALVMVTTIRAQSKVMMTWVSMWRQILSPSTNGQDKHGYELPVFLLVATEPLVSERPFKTAVQVTRTKTSTLTETMPKYSENLSTPSETSLFCQLPPTRSTPLISIFDSWLLVRISDRPAMTQKLPSKVQHPHQHQHRLTIFHLLPITFTCHRTPKIKLSIHWNHEFRKLSRNAKIKVSAWYAWTSSVFRSSRFAAGMFTARSVGCIRWALGNCVRNVIWLHHQPICERFIFERIHKFCNQFQSMPLSTKEHKCVVEL